MPQKGSDISTRKLMISEFTRIPKMSLFSELKQHGGTLLGASLEFSGKTSMYLTEETVRLMRRSMGPVLNI
jgi:hypothetical protein